MKLLKKIWRNEAGLALPIVLLLLLFGGFLVAPTLMFMSTGLNTGIVIEQRTEGYYAADAGVEDCLWDLLQDTPSHFQGSPPATWVLSEVVNDMDVTLDWLSKDPDPYYSRAAWYTIKSTARSNGTEKGQIVARIKLTDIYEAFFKNAITSLNNINLQPGVWVEGDIQYGGDDTTPNWGQVNHPTGDLINERPDWPDPAVMQAFYNDPNLSVFNKPKIDVADPDYKEGLGPWYVTGNLDITKGKDTKTKFISSPNSPPNKHVAMYVTGNLEINPSKGCEINMNGKTIFVEGDVRIWPDCTVTGPGQIIALGNINFQPEIKHYGAIEEDAMFVMSLNGTVNFQPSGDFFGALAGNVLVNLQPENKLIYPEFGGDWEFPPGDPRVLLKNYSIEK